MRIVIEALGLIPRRTGGMETYVRELLKSFAALPDPHEYRVVIGREARGITPQDSRFREFVADGGLPTFLLRHRYIQSVWQCIRLDWYLRRIKYDVLHCTMSFLKPPWGARSTVTTVHDLNMVLYPELWEGTNPQLAAALVHRAIRKSVAIITVSHFARETILSHFGVPAEKVVAVYNGVRLLGTADGCKPAVSATKSTRPFLLYPAGTFPHKNHRRLLQAWSVVRERIATPPKLILTGAPKTAHDQVLHLINQLNLEDLVEWRGWVSDEELDHLYRSALALVFPSLYEGFGLPVVEAMARGCPVVCSGTTSVGEVAGDAALTFDPTNVEAMATAICRIIEDGALREQLRQKGLRRAACFSWDRTAQETLKVYSLVSGA